MAALVVQLHSRLAGQRPKGQQPNAKDCRAIPAGTASLCLHCSLLALDFGRPPPRSGHALLVP